jgi:hypothetical protein
MKARPFYFDLTSDFISCLFICFLFIYLLFIYSFIYLFIHFNLFTGDGTAGRQTPAYSSLSQHNYPWGVGWSRPE